MEKFILFLVLFFISGRELQAQKLHYKTFKSITLLNDQSPDTCLLTCFVVDTYTCPPCPPGAQCKPCLGDHVMVSDTENDKKNFMRLFTNLPEQYNKGKKYTFLIKLHKTKQKRVYEAVLISEKDKTRIFLILNFSFDEVEHAIASLPRDLIY